MIVSHFLLIGAIGERLEWNHLPTGRGILDILYDPDTEVAVIIFAIVVTIFLEGVAFLQNVIAPASATGESALAWCRERDGMVSQSSRNVRVYRVLKINTRSCYSCQGCVITADYGE